MYVGVFPDIPLGPVMQSGMPLKDAFNNAMKMEKENIVCVGDELPSTLRIPLVHKAMQVQCKVLRMANDDIVLVTDINSHLQSLAVHPKPTFQYK